MPTPILPTLSAGTFGGTILGIAGLLSLMTYGGNLGCAPIIDKLFGTQGYESCGAFGLIGGILLGSLLGILLVRSKQVQRPGLTSILILVSAFLLPVIFGIFTFTFGDPTNSIVTNRAGLFFITSLTITFELISLFTSAVVLFIIGLIQWLTKNFILFLQQLTHTR